VNSISTGRLLPGAPRGGDEYWQLLLRVSPDHAVSACAWVIALLLGSIIARSHDGHAWLVRFGNAWVELFRNPAAVQMFLWYFVIRVHPRSSAGSWRLIRRRAVLSACSASACSRRADRRAVRAASSRCRAPALAAWRWADAAAGLPLRAAADAFRIISRR